MLTGTFWDLDGVLVDGAPWHREAFDLALEHFGCDGLSNEEHYGTFNGLSTYRKLEILGTMNRFPYVKSIHDRFYLTKQKYTIDLIQQNCKPIQRVIDVLNTAYNCGPMAVVTNCSRSTAHMMLSQAGILDYFDAIVTNEDTFPKIKPSPYPYRLAMKELCMDKPSRCLGIEDNQKGIDAVMGAGMNLLTVDTFESLTVEWFNRMKWVMNG